MFEYNVIIGRNVIILKAMKGNRHGKEKDIQHHGNRPGRRNGRLTYSLVHPGTPGRTQTLIGVGTIFRASHNLLNLSHRRECEHVNKL